MVRDRIISRLYTTIDASAPVRSAYSRSRNAPGLLQVSANWTTVSAIKPASVQRADWNTVRTSAMWESSDSR